MRQFNSFVRPDINYSKNLAKQFFFFAKHKLFPDYIAGISRATNLAELLMKFLHNHNFETCMYAVHFDRKLHFHIIIATVISNCGHRPENKLNRLDGAIQRRRVLRSCFSSATKLGVVGSR